MYRVINLFYFIVNLSKAEDLAFQIYATLHYIRGERFYGAN